MSPLPEQGTIGAQHPAQPAAARRRTDPAKQRIDRALFALVRGWVSGMDAREIGRYHLNLEPRSEADLRVVKTRLQTALDELAAAARREGRVQEAALLKRQAARIRPRQVSAPVPVASAAELPTLEEFAERFPPDFYREDELIELYQAEFGSGGGSTTDGAAPAGESRRTGRSTEARRSRLIERQLDLIRFLEDRLGAAMTHQSLLVDWLDATTAQRLESAGLRTVFDLTQRIEGSRQRWWAGIRAVGEAKARRIEHLLEASLGPLRRAAAAPRPAAGAAAAARAEGDPTLLAVPGYQAVEQLGIVPLERLRVPHELDGSQGTLRIHDGAALIDARNDHEAILAFLATHTSEHTRRAYRKELERFLLWAVVERKKPLSSMTVDDCVAYQTFLADPAPRAIWCGVRSRQRFGPLWRPFEGPLSARSQVHAIQSLHTFYRWAGEVRYLAGNPWAHVKATGPALPTEAARSARADTVERHDAGLRMQVRPRERALSVEQWRFVCGELATLPENGRTRRLRFVLALAYSTGLRLSELVRARRAHLSFEAPDADDPGGWTLAVLGKGDRLREVTLLDEVVAALQRYLAERHLPEDLAVVDPGVYLIGRVDDLRERLKSADTLHGVAPLAAGDGVKGTTLYKELKGFFAHCADSLEARDAKGAARLRAASTHWLRHSHATHALARGVPLQIVREVLGHASLSTTSRYVKPERGDQRRALRKLSGLMPPERPAG